MSRVESRSLKKKYDKKPAAKIEEAAFLYRETRGVVDECVYIYIYLYIFLFILYTIINDIFIHTLHYFRCSLDSFGIL